MTTVVLVHGAYHDGSCWELVRTALDERGVANQALDLPFAGLDADADAVAKLLDAVDGPVVLCGHSYGGMVISRAASGRDDVDRLVYLCAVQADENPELAGTMTIGPELLAALVHDDDGSSHIDPAAAPAAFYHDCDPEVTENALRHLRPMTVPIGADPSVPAPPAAWKSIPSTYVVCTDDRTIAPESQRMMAANADAVVEWDTSHSPMLSRPDLVADLLADLAASVGEAEGAR